jgi:hypothetical protein
MKYITPRSDVFVVHVLIIVLEHNAKIYVQRQKKFHQKNKLDTNVKNGAITMRELSVLDINLNNSLKNKNEATCYFVLTN